MKRLKTLQSKVVDKLSTMELGDKFRKKDFMLKHWYNYDYFSDRSLSVMLVHAKRTVKETFPDRDFKSIGGYITRIK